MSDREKFLYATNDGHSWQFFRNQKWLDMIETGICPDEWDPVPMVMCSIHFRRHELGSLACEIYTAELWAGGA